MPKLGGAPPLGKPISFDTLYAAFKLLDPEGSVYLGTELLHFVPAEVTRDKYAPYCELLAAFGLTDPRPKDEHLGFYVQHWIPREMVGGPFTGKHMNNGTPRSGRDDRLKLYKLSARYKALMEDVQKLQEYEALCALRDNLRGRVDNMLDSQRKRLGKLFNDRFVSQWRKP